MTRIDPDKLGEYLSGYLDGELDEAERVAVEELLGVDSAARDELEKLRETASLVGELPRHRAPATLASEVMTRIERRQLPEDEPLPSAAPPWRMGRLSC